MLHSMFALRLEMNILLILKVKWMPKETTPWPLGVPSITEPVKLGLAGDKLDYGEIFF